MSQLEELYKQVILDHYKNPRNKGELEDPNARAVGFNPLCGDEVVVTLNVVDDVITDIRLGGNGCSISQSSASMMSAAVKSKTIGDARQLTTAVKEMLAVHVASIEEDQSERDQAEPVSTQGSQDSPVRLGDLVALQGVVQFPVRIKCALLSWNTLLEALDLYEQDATA